MDQFTTSPLDEQEIFCVKERIPELQTFKNVGSSQKTHFFNGVILEASSELVIGDKTVAENVLMKPNCDCAISQSNKRYLKEYNINTDYVEPNPLLFRALGFSEQESKILTYALVFDELPIVAMVTAYNFAEQKEDEALPEPAVMFKSKEDDLLTNTQAIKLVADWLFENGYSTSLYEEYEKFDNIEDAWIVSEISAIAREYAEKLEEEPHAQFEAACFYECAVDLVEELIVKSKTVYTLLQKKYNSGGLILAALLLTWGVDEMGETVLCYDVGTTDTAIIASQDLYDRKGTLTNMIDSVIFKYFESVGYSEEYAMTSRSSIPDIPEDILDEISDTYMYIAEAICDDFSFEIHM